MTPKDPYRAPAGFGTGGRLTQAFIALSLLSVAIVLVQAIAELTGNGAISRLGTRNSANPFTNLAHLYGGTGMMLVNLSGVLAGLALTVVFAIWLFRALRNLEALPVAPAQRMSPVLALIGTIVPYMNLVVPYLALRQVWRASASTPDPADMMAWKRIPVPPLINIWYVVYLAGTVIAVTVGMTAGVWSAANHGLTGPSVMVAEVGIALASLTGAAAALIRIPIVRSIDELQQSRFDGRSPAGQPQTAPRSY